MKLAGDWDESDWIWWRGVTERYEACSSCGRD